MAASDRALKLRGSSRKEFVRSGVILDVLARYPDRCLMHAFDVYVVEGDTDECGRIIRGGETRRVRQRLSVADGDRFLRWAELTIESRRRARIGARYVS